MRIAIDARLNAYRQGGISQYTRQLLQALAEVAANERFISFQHRDMLRPLVVAPNVARRTAYTPPHHRYEPWVLPLEVALARADVLHCPDFIAPRHRTCAAVVTIHDLAFLHYPQILDDAARAYYGQIKASSAHAEGIIAVSEATRQDIAQLLDIPYAEITVIHEAAAPLYAPMELRSGEVRVLGDVPVAAGNFLLFVSTLEPRKNLPTLLQALRLCVDRRPERNYQLVVVGGRGWRDQPIFDAIRDLRLGDHLLLAGNVGQYDLRWLYNACRLYINPSLYEGFGLPLLEAMACGAPCLASAASSLPEVGGEAVQYVAPLDAEQWAAAIEALWDDEDRRAELGRRGLARAQQFSWQRAARETLKVYEAAVARRAQEPGARSQEPGARRQEADHPHSDAHAAALAGRRCVRCGAAMTREAVEPEVRVEIRSSAAWDTNAPQSWRCPHCGHAELLLAHAQTLPALVPPTPPVMVEVPPPERAAAQDHIAPAEMHFEQADNGAALLAIEHNGARAQLPLRPSNAPAVIAHAPRDGHAARDEHIAHAPAAPRRGHSARRKKP